MSVQVVCCVPWASTDQNVICSGTVSGNAELSKDITAWTFQESLVLRVDNATHYLASDAYHAQRSRYTTNDELVSNVQWELPR